MDTGAIILDNGYRISGKLTKSDFLASNVSEAAEICLINRGFASYRLQPQLFRGNTFTITLFFENEKLYNVNLYLNSSLRGDSWGEYDIDNEMKVKSEQDIFLKECLGDPPYAFSWGIIDSLLDGKSGFSKIVISYKNNREDILHLLSGINDALASFEGTWQRSFQRSLTEYQSIYNLHDEKIFLQNLKSIYRGMGSFGDLVLSKDGRPLLDENILLDKLRNDLYSLASDRLEELEDIC